MPNPTASSKKSRGRTSITDTVLGQPSGKNRGPTATKPNVPQEIETETNRPIGNGGGKHRGDRRDMSKTYSGNKKHAARGNTPRKDVSTRER